MKNWKNIKVWPLTLISAVLFSFSARATVCFITDTEDCSGYEFSNTENMPDGGEGNPDGYDPDNENRCIKEGYTIHSCPDGYVLGGLKCPYGDYYTECLIVCPDDYVTCNAPYSGYGEACDGKYAKCCQVCPPEYAYTEIPAGYVQDGEECFDCSGLTKYKVKEDSCDGYLDCGVVGGVEGAQTCVKGTTILYSECNECPNEGKLTTCPAHATCTYEECSGLWYIESCEDGYVLDSTGMKCVEEDLCKNVTCGANAYCSEGKCYCNEGYEGNAYTGCTKIDPCDNVTCGTNAYCSNGKCYCNNGFEGDPYSKCTPIDNDPCKDVTCGANAYCSNGSCYCSYGYTGNPYTGCTKKDPCDDITCGVNAYCANGSCYCNPGYEGNAYTGCTKSDPCDDVTCGANAYCSNGSCYCYSGYEGNAYSGCTRIDPCDNVTCGANAYCSNGSCYCDYGYEGNAYSGCTKIDPCDNVTCGANAHCSNGTCVCDTGYEGNANTGCTKIDPCDNITCGANAHCSNGTCVCDTGYEGNANTGCTKICVSGGSASCTGQTSACSSSQVQTSSCKDCSGVMHYSCRAKTCAEQGKKDCNGTCIEKTACCGGCPSGQKCENGTCVDECVPLADETGCQLGTTNCSDGCGGTRKCCIVYDYSACCSECDRQSLNACDWGNEYMCEVLYKCYDSCGGC